MSAIDKQVGGSHYKNMSIQPWDMGYAIFNGDGGAIKILKYLTRDKDDKREQFAKAAHVVELRRDTGVDITWDAELTYAKRVLLRAFCRQFPEPMHLQMVLLTYMRGEWEKAIEAVYSYSDALSKAED